MRSHGRVFLGGKNTPQRHRRTSIQTNELLFFSAQVDSARQCLQCHFILLSSLQPTRSFSYNAHLYCYVIYLSHSRHEGMHALRSISGTGGWPYFSLSLISCCEKGPNRVYKVTHNFALSRLTNVLAYPKLWHSVKVCFRERKRDREAKTSARR